MASLLRGPRDAGRSKVSWPQCPLFTARPGTRRSHQDRNDEKNLRLKPKHNQYGPQLAQAEEKP